MKAFMKVLALQKLRNGVLRHQADEIVSGKVGKPAPVEVDHSFLRIENLENLRLVRFSVFLDLLASQRRTRGRAPRWIADHSGEVADQKDCRVPKILKVLQLAQNDSVAKVQV